MEWVESISNLISATNGWVLGGCLLSIFVIVGCYSTRLLAWVLVFALIVGHQDYWVWLGKPERSFFELPSGFVYHVGLSIGAAVVWWIVTMEAWPEDGFEQPMDSPPSDSASDHAGGEA